MLGSAGYKELASESFILEGNPGAFLSMRRGMKVPHRVHGGINLKYENQQAQGWPLGSPYHRKI